MSKVDMFLWCERYRPKTVAECILPNDLKVEFQSYVDNGQIPNITLAGAPGVGKTSIALAMISEVGALSYKVNTSLKGNIDLLRNEITDFASSVAMNGKRKYVILDEADKCTHAFQEGLRAFIEEFSDVCGFILTCNNKSRLTAAIQSRCPVKEFRIPKDESRDILTQMGRRVVAILNENKIAYDKDSLVAFLRRWFPDMRRTLGELQGYAQARGKIDAGILAQFTETRLQPLLKAMQEKNFSDVRKWVTDNSDIDPADLFRKFYDQAATLIAPESIPVLVVILAKYQFQSAFVADQDINTASCLAEVMVEIGWK